MIRGIRWLAVFGLAFSAIFFFFCIWTIAASAPIAQNLSDPAMYFRQSFGMTSSSVLTLLTSALLYVACEIATRLDRSAPRDDQD